MTIKFGKASLAKLTVADLKKICASLSVKGCSAKTKELLIKVVIEGAKGKKLKIPEDIKAKLTQGSTKSTKTKATKATRKKVTIVSPKKEIDSDDEPLVMKSKPKGKPKVITIKYLCTDDMLAKCKKEGKVCNAKSGKCVTKTYAKKLGSQSEYVYAEELGLVGEMDEVKERRKRCDSVKDAIKCKSGYVCSADSGKCIEESESSVKGKYTLNVDGRVIIGDEETIVSLAKQFGRGDITGPDVPRYLRKPLDVGKTIEIPCYEPGGRRCKELCLYEEGNKAHGKCVKDTSVVRKGREIVDIEGRRFVAKHDAISKIKKLLEKKSVPKSAVKQVTNIIEELVQTPLGEEEEMPLTRRTQPTKSSAKKVAEGPKVYAEEKDVLQTFQDCLSSLNA